MPLPLLSIGAPAGAKEWEDVVWGEDRKSFSIEWTTQGYLKSVKRYEVTYTDGALQMHTKVPGMDTMQEDDPASIRTQLGEWTELGNRLYASLQEACDPEYKASECQAAEEELAQRARRQSDAAAGQRGIDCLRDAECRAKLVKRRQVSQRFRDGIDTIVEMGKAAGYDGVAEWREQLK